MTDPQRRQRLRILPTYVMETLSTRLNVAATPEALLDALIKAPVDAHLLNRFVWGIGSDVEAFFKHCDSWLVYEKNGRFDIVIIAYTQPLATQSICSLFQIADGTCAQSDLDCSYTKYDKAAKKYAILCHKYISLGSQVVHMFPAQT